jgi:hypothetical protein
MRKIVFFGLCLILNWAEISYSDSRDFGHPMSDGYVLTQNYDNYLVTKDVNGNDKHWGHHAGIDWAHAGNPNGIEPIYSIGVGTIHGYVNSIVDDDICDSDKGWGNHVVVRHLLDSGFVWYSQYAHFSGGSVPDFNAGDPSVGDRVVKNYELGKMGCSGNSTGPHLHFQVRNSSTMGNGYYTSGSAGGQGFVNPVDFINGDYGRPLLPHLSNTNKSPDRNDYEIYGLVGQPLYGGLKLDPVERTSFADFGIGGRSANDMVADIFIETGSHEIDRQTSFFGYRADNDQDAFGPSLVCDSENGCDYQFFAYIGELNNQNYGQWGYRLKFSIVPLGSEIIDNDGLLADATGDFNNFNPGYFVANHDGALDVAGYYVSGKLFQGGSGQWARWFPTNSGNFKVFIHVPSGANTGSANYKILPKGRNPEDTCSPEDTEFPCYTSDPINHAANNGEWVQLTLNNNPNTTFDFSQGGYVDFNAGSAPIGELIGIDAVKFLGADANGETPREDPEKPASSALNGIIRDENGNGIEGAEVQLFGPNSSMPSNKIAITDEEGRFAISGIETFGYYYVQVDKDGYHLFDGAKDAFELSSGQTYSNFSVVLKEDSDFSIPVCPPSLKFDYGVIIPDDEVHFVEIPVEIIDEFLREHGSPLYDLDLSEYELDPEIEARDWKTWSIYVDEGSKPWALDELKDNRPTTEKYSPAEIIYLAAKENDVNPVVLLSYLQKEQGLIKTGSFSNFQNVLNRAVGYGMLESGDLPEHYGFLAQMTGLSYQINEDLKTYFLEYSRIVDGTTLTVKSAFAHFHYVYTPHLLSAETLFPVYNEFRKYFLDKGYSVCDELSSPPVGPLAIFIETLGDRALGDIKILPTNFEADAFGPSDSVKIEGVEVSDDWASDGLYVNDIYSQANIDWGDLSSPIHIEIVNEAGNRIADTFYPFSDIEPSAWYLPAAMKLWKENVISGYEGDKENTFKPGQEATRAEYLITALKADEKANFPNRTYPPYNAGLFGDVSSPDWFADYVQYAWEQQIEEGCDPGSNEFCPHEAFTRAEAVSLTGRTFDYLRTTAENYNPPALDEFSDVTSSADPFYEYVYSLRDHDVLDGYPDGTFRLENTVTRAEMVKFNCIAAFGVEECLFPQHMDTPFVTAVWPQNATLDEPTTFTVDGYNLPDSLAFTLADCADLEPLGGNENQRQFRCTPTQPGEVAGTILENANGGELQRFTVTVKAPPIVTSVSPTTATYEEPTIFTVLGENLTNETAFWIAHCEGLEPLGGDATSREFQCTPSHETGLQDGVVKDRPEGNELFSFTLDVQEAAAPVQPTVTSVSPLTATYEEPTIFTVRGQSLPDTTAFWIANCYDLQSLGGDASERQFQCTPRYQTGTQEGVVKNHSGGTELLSFSIEVQEETVPTLPPSVNSISPTTATLGESTVFTVNGQNLTSSTALWIDDCQDLVSLGGNADQQRFRCTPSHQSGLQDGEVKDQPNGNILLDFSINVESAPVPAQPIVTSVAPLTATLSELTTFTVYGENLPVSTALYVAGCEDVSYVGGTSSARRFQCIPMYKAAIRDGLVKDEVDGTILYNFDVEVVPGIPTVTGVTPLNATKGERTTFVVSGTSLPETTTIWIAHCDSVVSFGGTAEEKVFECTPAYETGPQDGVVKDESGGSTLHSFTVNFQ